MQMRSENFLVGVWLEGGEEKNVVGPKCFLPDPSKCFLSKMQRKLRDLVFCQMDKNAPSSFPKQRWPFIYLFFFFFLLLLFQTLWSRLVHSLKYIFSVFKQHYTYFHTLFHSHIFLNTCLQFLSTCTKHPLCLFPFFFF